MKMNVLELFSGIGGMHMALEESGVEGNVVASVEINPNANVIYRHNFPEINILNKNIEGLTGEFINKLDINTILMSPPCQPFTRNGLKNDVKDTRTNPFMHILNLLPELTKVGRILIENVKGFEKSEMRGILLDVLKKNDFIWQEFILTPTQIGVPNTRHRYYCLAKRRPLQFDFDVGDLMEILPNYNSKTELYPISEILEKTIKTEEYMLSEKVLVKRLKVLDICYSDSKRSCCFTKAYSKFLEGTGSVYTAKSQKEYKEVCDEISINKNDRDKISLMKSLELRFFSPKEISRLMSFPEKFSFPDDGVVKLRQKYMLLGNSINVKVVSELIKLLK
ncbi:unnamed protein product [Brassicogethes aeneus]|uniref:Uncharacterized protein n=1 Tax=Brassicogethes aeneus TaxID=1431903 RepID=A0A9P0FPP7_BRAAE|nr:unnamed protein product [Brassicogethes aeneus]